MDWELYDYRMHACQRGFDSLFCFNECNRNY
jgi:hypothetical protein